ncbi:MAG: GTPase [Clostridia bacterium]|nr:GTPase [Clostridia bacterium]
MKREVPCYLFTGFIDSGKTTFLQETLEDERFNDGKESTLVLMCEQGDTELDLSEERFPQGTKNIHVEYLESEKKLNPVNLERLEDKYQAEKIMIEYNGMWLINLLVDAMPENWMIYQEYSFAESDSFLMYNQSMRQLVFDKLQTCDVIVFNRFDDTKLDFMEFHKVVRAISRRADIFYEDYTREARVDDIEDPLPFDKEKKSFTVEDRDYALWYRDLSDDMDSYEGKIVTVKGALGTSKDLKGSDFVFGRELMTCCVQDIKMAALCCEWSGEPITKGDWAIVTGKIAIKKHKAYGNNKGPVLIVEKIEKCEALEDPVATFY